MTTQSEKKLVGYAAAEVIEENSVVGIGTGSTVHYFIERLGERVKEGLSIQAVSSSQDSSNKAKKLGIPLTDFGLLKKIDVTVDGADELDPNWNMIKGGGGALFREKMLAYHSEAMYIVVDRSKRVSALGKHPLPIEILPFYHQAIIQELNRLGYTGEVRVDDSGQPYVTDNNNYIYDIHNTSPIDTPEKTHRELKQITGVLETGLFFNVGKKVFSINEDGQCVVEEK